MSEDWVMLAEGLDFPEGPVFDNQGNIWCVEVKGGNLVCFKGSKVRRYSTGGAPNGLTLDTEGRLWFCDSALNAIRTFNNRDNGYCNVVDAIEGLPLDKPNDLIFDMKGNLIFTCPGNSRTEATGYVCCLKNDGTLKKITAQKYYPNGLALINGGTELVIAETYQRRLWIGKWDPDSCEWTDSRPWVSFEAGLGPDGMALGEDGLLYVAVYGSGLIVGINTCGEIVKQYELPGKNPTNVAFDEFGKHGIVVTEAEQGILLALPGVGSCNKI